MAIVSDFTLIQGDADQVIGDGSILWEKTFATNGRLDNQSAILMLMVQGLTGATADVDVVINGVVVGHIFRYNGAHASHWYTNIINIEGGKLRDGDNTLRLLAVPTAGGGGDNFDDFAVRDVVCFFHQNA